jgi:two-component system chemotaxis response regulator CheB
MKRAIRVLVVDDSAVMRKLIPEALLQDSSIEVVGTAMDGEMGLKKLEELKPDVVTLDLDMPRMDGMEMLRQITRKHHVPVIVVSAHTEEGAALTLKALGLGAFDFVTKPQDAARGQMKAIAAELSMKIKAAASSGAPKMILTIPTLKKKEPPKFSTQPRWPSRIVAIGVSTGGPQALQYLFSQIPADFPGCVVVVQHMPAGFTQMFAQRLDESGPLEVKEAQSGDLLLAGRVLVCPGDRHIKVRRMDHGDVAILVDQARVNGHRPSADVLFQSVAQEFGRKTIGVLMTGMGEDGAAGLGAIRDAGGHTIAQHPDSCVVDSMPRAAIENGFAMRIVSLASMAEAIVARCAGDFAPEHPAAAPQDLSMEEIASRRRSS